MRDILKLPEATMDRFRFLFTDQRSYNKNLGIIWACGDIWEEQRKYTIKQLREFGFGKVRSMEESIKEEVDCLFEELKMSGGIWAVDSTRLSVVSINVLWSSIGGYRFKPDHFMTKRHIEVNSKLFEMIGPNNVLTAFPFLKFFPRLSGYKKQMEAHKYCQDFIKELINDAKEKMQGRQQAESFVEVYLKEVEKNKNTKDSNFTEEQLIVLLMDLFLAGSESTSTVMNWAILFFALFPDAQSKAKAEIQKHFNTSADISLSAYTSMPYIRACIWETMRLAPFAPHPPPRRASKDIEYGKYRIPKGTLLLFTLYPVFHDKVYWGDPEVFRPDRFLHPNSVNLDSRKLERVAQFGFGKRACPGENLAINTLFLFYVMLLTEFTVEIVNGEKPTMEPKIPSVTLAPNQYSVLLKERMT